MGDSGSPGLVDCDQDAGSTWRHAGNTTALALVSAEEAVQLKAHWLALLESYLARTQAIVGQRHAGHRVGSRLTGDDPLPDHDTEEDIDDRLSGADASRRLP
jgi:hypothetical protein